MISTMTAAQMRKMMEGVVLVGTAKDLAPLNGYTSGGKTGTAQKIDVATHRYSKTKYIASFVGIAPVNNPAISVAVIIDSPEGNHYGNVNAAPVFREVAQEVLEYLGVPHDTNVTAQTDLAKAHKARRDGEAPTEHIGDLDALFAEVNNLPADDPLRGSGNGQQPVPSAANELPPGAEQEAQRMRASATSYIAPSRCIAAAIPVHPAEPKEETPSFDAAVAAREPPLPVIGVVVNAGAGSGSHLFWGNRCGWLSSRPRPPAWPCRLWAAGLPGSRCPHRGAWCPPVLRSWSASLAEPALPLDCHTWDARLLATASGALRKLIARCSWKEASSSSAMGCDGVFRCPRWPASQLGAKLVFNVGRIVSNCVWGPMRLSDGRKPLPLLCLVSPANWESRQPRDFPS